MSGPAKWLFDEYKWRSLQGAVELQVRVQLRDDGRVLEREEFERQYDALSVRLGGTLFLPAWAVRGQIVRSDLQGMCTVYLDGGDNAWHRWVLPLTDEGFSRRAQMGCLAIPLAKTVKNGWLPGLRTPCCQDSSRSVSAGWCRYVGRLYLG